MERGSPHWLIAQLQRFSGLCFDWTAATLGTGRAFQAFLIVAPVASLITVHWLGLEFVVSAIGGDTFMRGFASGFYPALWVCLAASICRIFNVGNSPGYLLGLSVVYLVVLRILVGTERGAILLAYWA